MLNDTTEPITCPRCFLSAYIECALWSSTDNADDTGGEPLGANYTPDDIHPDTMAQMIRDCNAFYDSAEGGSIEGPGGRWSRSSSLEWTVDDQMGHDFWLTRNGHGAGFWDRSEDTYGDVETRDRLDQLARPYGSFDLYIGDDGLIHGM